MSDFDKEAEREKLREKYERDKQERQATQRMSDLLLKGATMTNAHCGTCGDPLFQQDGTTFCPSCHGNPDAVQGTDLEARPAEETPEEPVDEAAADSHVNREAASNSTDASDDAASADTDSAAPADTDSAAVADATSTAGGETDHRQRQPTGTDAATDSHTSSEDASAAESPSRDARSSSAQSPTDSSGRDTARQSATDDRRSGDRHASSPQPADGDLEAARASLVRALEKFAGKAAATDDPRYARECLEAAREASETLETLR